MAQKINVNRNVQDPFYRYKMPRIVAKVEGKGNGIKTVIANMPEIAKALSRPPTYPTKYFGCELGAQTNFDLKNERYIVNGEHDASKLQDLLDGFIRKFVLCANCENPETVLTIKKSSVIHAKCKACGHVYQIDPKQKLSTYILKNPPPQENGDTADSTAKGTENGGTPPGEEVASANDEIATDNGNNQHSGGSVDEADDDDWAPEPDGETEKLSGEMRKMVVDKDLEKTENDRLDLLHQFYQKAAKDGTIQDGKKMLNEAERLELKTKAPLLLADVLFTTEILAQMKQFQKLLLRFCINDKKAQRYLLYGIEQTVEANKDVLLAKSAHIIKALYDNDLCEEEVLLEWEKKPSRKFVNKNFVKEMIAVAQPVLNWLKEAEEGSETDDEAEDGDMAVAFDDRSRAVGTTIVEEKINKKEDDKGQANGKQKVTDDDGMEDKKKDGGAKIDEDDVDIDNI